MARKKSKPEKKWSLYPGWHDEVSSLLEQEDLFLDFNHNDDDRTCMKSYDTNIMGHFVCRNGACTKGAHGWGSKKIAITIRMYPGASYNARVYSQRCKHCDTVSSPTLDDSYPERVAYRIKKWCGIELDRPLQRQHRGPPHEKDLCEGCKDGHCAAGRGG